MRVLPGLLITLVIILSPFLYDALTALAETP